ncbi:MAG: hydrolase [Oscillospiraceae bacterium]|jgi:hypothetical protein|nr:hydrolase [Oscillospiraceae bacterium]
MTNKEKFTELATTRIKREGITKLLDWLETTDFYTSPASTKYHLAVEGGLLQHSLNVYDRLLRLYEAEHGTPCAERHETIAVVALFHDVCKANCYKKSLRNVKVYSETGTRTDNGGNYDWETQECYVFEEKFPFGYHGPKSAFLVDRALRLTTEEYVCIANHMGMYDRLHNDYSLAKAFETYGLAFLLHTADCFAVFSEKEKPSDGC